MSLNFAHPQASADSPSNLGVLSAAACGLDAFIAQQGGDVDRVFGIAGIDRMVQRNVLAMSGRAIEAAGDVDILMLDKTGTITLGNRQAHAFIPVDGATPEELADAAQLLACPGALNGLVQALLRMTTPGVRRSL